MKALKVIRVKVSFTPGRVCTCGGDEAADIDLLVEVELHDQVVLAGDRVDLGDLPRSSAPRRRPPRRPAPSSHLTITKMVCISRLWPWRGAATGAGRSRKRGVCSPKAMIGPPAARPGGRRAPARRSRAGAWRGGAVGRAAAAGLGCRMRRPARRRLGGRSHRATGGCSSSAAARRPPALARPPRRGGRSRLRGWRGCSPALGTRRRAARAAGSACRSAARSPPPT